MKVINQAIGRGNASDGSPRAQWKPVRRLAVFAAVALALLLIAAAGAGNNSTGDIAAAGVIGAVVGYFILRMLASSLVLHRTFFEYDDGKPAYPNRRVPTQDEDDGFGASLTPNNIRNGFMGINPATEWFCGFNRHNDD